MRSLIVGSHFRPPAKVVLANLPTGAKLFLKAEPDNPYDPLAVQVWVWVEEIPSSRHSLLEMELPFCGSDLETLLKGEKLWLGYVAKKGGKPLQGTGLAGAEDFLRQGFSDECWLSFDESGEPMVNLEETEHEDG